LAPSDGLQPHDSGLSSTDKPLGPALFAPAPTFREGDFGRDRSRLTLSDRGNYPVSSSQGYDPMNEPRGLRLARALVLLNAFLWLVFALIIAAGFHPSYPTGGPYQVPMALAAFGGTAVLSALAWLLRRPTPLVYWAAVGILAATVLMGLFDEVGLADLAFIFITLLPIAFLVKSRRWYLRPSAPEELRDPNGV
jgi:hypothetical protein